MSDPSNLLPPWLERLALSEGSTSPAPVCVVCGRTFHAKNCKQKTCGAACSKKHREALRKAWRKSHPVNMAAHSKTNAERRRKAPATRTCDTCGNSFQASHPNMKRCGADCAWTAKRLRENTATDAYRKQHPDRHHASILKYVLKKGYKLTPKDFHTMMVAQDGRCAICKTTDPGQANNGRLVVDHNHQTGKVRGLLCFHCNIAIGHLRDDPDLLREAASYLERGAASVNPSALLSAEVQ